MSVSVSFLLNEWKYNQKNEASVFKMKETESVLLILTSSFSIHFSVHRDKYK